jgi:hypothetical protein
MMFCEVILSGGHARLVQHQGQHRLLTVLLNKIHCSAVLCRRTDFRAVLRIRIHNPFLRIRILEAN